MSFHSHDTARTGADITMLQRVIARDAAALGELCDTHSRLLFGLILRILRDRGDAEDVLQEVFVQAWTRAHTYSLGLGSPIGWLLGIARNRAIDRLRRKSAQQRAVDGAAEPLASDDPEPLAALEERRGSVQEALDALPRDQRELWTTKARWCCSSCHPKITCACRRARNW